MEDLQGLLERINRDGVEKANAEADRIISAAKAKANTLLEYARNEAAKAKVDAENAAISYSKRAEETIRQSARDVVLGVKDAITTVLEQLLTKEVETALFDTNKTAELVFKAIQDITGPGEITAGNDLARAIATKLAQNGDFTIVIDENIGAGFTVKLDHGRVEHSFTVEAIADALAKQLRPDLAKLLK